MYSGLCKIFMFTALIGSQLMAGPLMADEALNAELNGEFSQALKAYERMLGERERFFGLYDVGLMEPLLGLARTYLADDQTDAALKAARRAQHIAHRQYGVYGSEQVQAIEILMATQLRELDILAANRSQAMLLKIAESSRDEPPLARLEARRDWLLNTGQSTQALATIDRLLAAAPDPQRQLRLMVDRVRVERQRFFCCGYKTLLPGLTLLERHPEIAPEARAEFLLELADAYLLEQELEVAGDYYRAAWELMSSSQRVKHGKGAQLIAMKNRPFSKRGRMMQHCRLGGQVVFDGRRYVKVDGPVSRREVNLEYQRELQSRMPTEVEVLLKPNPTGLVVPQYCMIATTEPAKALAVIGYPLQFMVAQVRNMLADEPENLDQLDGLSVTLKFSVSETGKISDIKRLSDLTSQHLDALMAKSLAGIRLRPRLVDGLAVATERMVLVQRFF